MRHALAALDRIEDVLRGAGDELGRRRVPLQQFRERLHPHQHVVEFVGHGCGEAAQGVDAMRLRELLLEHLALGDVARVEQQPAHRRAVQNRLDHHFERAPCAVLDA